MEPHLRPAVHIEYAQSGDGVFYAQCPELGLSTEGATMAEAEAALMRLVDERFSQLGELEAPTSVESDRDTSLEPDESERVGR